MLNCEILVSAGEQCCEIECEGMVHVEGVIRGGELGRRNPILSPPGSFTISFKLAGPVDPRLFSPTFRSDGILEGVRGQVERNAAECSSWLNINAVKRRGGVDGSSSGGGVQLIGHCNLKVEGRNGDGWVGGWGADVDRQVACGI
ncbi:hypothetical protein Ancab_007104 [Ancistrocladus abbreviatus]